MKTRILFIIISLFAFVGANAQWKPYFDWRSFTKARYLTHPTTLTDNEFIDLKTLKDSLENYSGGSGSTETLTNVGGGAEIVKALSGSNYDIRTFIEGALIDYTLTDTTFKASVDTVSANGASTKSYVQQQLASSSSLFNGDHFSISGSTVNLNPRIITSTGSAPTVAVGASFTGTATIVGNDVSGTITFNVTSGASYPTLAEMVTVTFNVPYSTTPRVVFSPSSSAAAAWNSQAYVKGASTTGFSIATAGSGTAAVVAGSTWNYHVIQ